jgi:hypothetical protein
MHGLHIQRFVCPKKKQKGQASSGTKTQSPSKERKKEDKVEEKSPYAGWATPYKALLSMPIEIGF